MRIHHFIKSFPIVLIGFIVIFLLVKQGCYGLVEGLIILLLSGIGILYLIIIIVIQVRKDKSQFDYNPIITFASIILVVLIISLLKSDHFKSKILFEASNEIVDHIKFRKNNKFDYTIKQPEFSCYYNGTFEIKNDTLILYQTPILSFNRFLILRSKNVLIPIGSDNRIVNDTVKILRIINNTP